LKNWNRINNFSFAAIAAALIITAGLVLGLSLPSIKSWQASNISRLIEQANTSKDANTKTYLLAQAALLGKNDPTATQAYANNLWGRGEYKQAIDAYASSWTKPDYNYLGELALKSGDITRAKTFFSKANSKGENSDSLSGLALVEFSNKNTNKGCEYSERALKLNLSSKKAEDSVTICQIEQGKSTLDKRLQSYKKLSNYLYADALSELQEIETKNTSDWLAIASIYANAGKLNNSIGALKSGLDQNPADTKIMQKLIDYLNIEGRAGEAQIYKERLQDLRFENFPSK